jgi:hypothetical protein
MQVMETNQTKHMLRQMLILLSLNYKSEVDSYRIRLPYNRVANIVSQCRSFRHIDDNFEVVFSYRTTVGHGDLGAYEGWSRSHEFLDHPRPSAYTWDEFEMLVAILLWRNNIQDRKQRMFEISAGKYSRPSR